MPFHVIRFLPFPIQSALQRLPARLRADIEEIRINQDRPVMVTLRDGDRFVSSHGLSHDPNMALVADARMVSDFLAALTQSSVYAVEDSMREGFLSLPGGHRVGLAGSVRIRDGRIEGYRHVVGFNIRLNRPITGIAHRLLRSIVKQDGRIWSTLIVSPPGCGKTTLLREIIRVLSYGDLTRGIRPLRVGVADERSEIGASHRGVPQNDLGPRVDIIDQCPKRYALSILLRSMGPDVLATDEIGHPQDAEAIADALGAGVSLICTTHGDSVQSLWQRPSIRPLMENQLFDKIVVLSRRRGPGTVEQVVEGRRTLSNGLAR